MTEAKQPESLRLADRLQNAVATYPQLSEDEPGGYCGEVDQVMDESAAELRRQHARIAELEAQLSSSGFTAADMATASAQGFRDGAASVAASAGSEPVAWQAALRAQPTPPAVVEPLTVQQIWASDEIMSANAMPMDDLLRIVRAVEAAHGITGGQHGTE